MSLIRGRGNKDTELALIEVFRKLKITGWNRHFLINIAHGQRKPAPLTNQKSKTKSQKLEKTSPLLPLRVRPDFVFLKLRMAVFVDGCFWHGCPQHATKPRSNAAFWRRKLAGNQVRDRLVTRTLRRAGWRVLRIWEHELARRRVTRLSVKLRRFFGG